MALKYHDKKTLDEALRTVNNLIRLEKEQIELTSTMLDAQRKRFESTCAHKKYLEGLRRQI
jgi:hypothetical protein